MSWIESLSFGEKAAIAIAVWIFPAIILAAYLFSRRFIPEDKPFDDPLLNNEESLRNQRAFFGKSFLRYLAWTYREAKRAEADLDDPPRKRPGV